MNEELPWVEKYRPAKLDQVVSQEDTVNVLSRSLAASSIPHLLFYGPPGTGKTSSIIAMAKELYGKELYKQRVLELNASDERGIDVVRSKIKDFAKISVAGKGPGFKLVILDEADSMTKDAQAALRRTMETYSKVTRFCLICNYLSRIIEPLASRCAKFRFKPLETSLMVDRLEYISREEGMAIGKDVFEINQTLEALVEVSEGDLRQAITLLQTCKGYSSTMGPQHIFEMTGTIPQTVMDELFQVWETKDVDLIRANLESVFLQGYSGLQLLSQIHKEIVDGSRMSKTQKAKLAIQVAKTEKRLFDGADEELQLLQLLCCS